MPESQKHIVYLFIKVSFSLQSDLYCSGLVPRPCTGLITWPKEAPRSNEHPLAAGRIKSIIFVEDLAMSSG